MRRYVIITILAVGLFGGCQCESDEKMRLAARRTAAAEHACPVEKVEYLGESRLTMFGVDTVAIDIKLSICSKGTAVYRCDRTECRQEDFTVVYMEPTKGATTLEVREVGK